MADRDFLKIRYKTAEFKSHDYGENVEKVQITFDGFLLEVEVMQNNSVDIDLTYPDGEKLTLESILRKKDDDDG